MWLDDVRSAPAGWTRTNTVRETIDLLRTGQVTEISLDYDLDATDPKHKGSDVLDWLEDRLRSGRIAAPVIHLHTINPFGAATMAWTLHRMERRHGPQPFRIRNGLEPDRFNRVPASLPDGDVELARRLLEEGALLIDVRSPEEYAGGYLTGAINIPHDQIPAQTTALAEIVGWDRPLVVYCVWGLRGAEAKVDLLEAGFQNVLNVGGLDGLLGRPLVREGGQLRA